MAYGNDEQHGLKACHAEKDAASCIDISGSRNQCELTIDVGCQGAYPDNRECHRHRDPNGRDSDSSHRGVRPNDMTGSGGPDAVSPKFLQSTLADGRTNPNSQAPRCSHDALAGRARNSVRASHTANRPRPKPNWPAE